MRLVLSALIAIGCWGQESPRELQAAWRKTMAAEIGDEETLDLFASQVIGRCEAMKRRALKVRELALIENPDAETRRAQFFESRMLAADYIDLVTTQYRRMARVVASAHWRPSGWRDRQEINHATPQWPQWGLYAHGRATVLCKEIAMLFGKSDATVGEDLSDRLAGNSAPPFYGQFPPLPTPEHRDH